MSMTREEAIEIFEQKGWWIAQKETLTSKQAEEIIKLNDAVNFALSALRPVSREQVEKVWRGEWTPGDSICPICEKNKFDGLDADIWADWMPSFCPNGKILCRNLDIKKHGEIGNRKLLSMWADTKKYSNDPGASICPILCCYVDGRPEYEKEEALKDGKGD